MPRIRKNQRRLGSQSRSRSSSNITSPNDIIEMGLEVANYLSDFFEQTRGIARRGRGRTFKSPKTRTRARVVPDSTNLEQITTASSSSAAMTNLDDSQPGNEYKSEVIKKNINTFIKDGGFVSDDDEDELPTFSVKESVVDVSDDVIKIEDNDFADLQSYRKETEDLLKNADNLLKKFMETEEKNPEPVSIKEDEAKTDKKLGDCPVCLENFSDKQVFTTKCGHLFCRECIDQICTTVKKCPACRKVVNKKNVTQIFI